MKSRERVLSLLAHQPIDRMAVFSGMGNVTVHGLNKYGWHFAEIHTDPQKMAQVAASTFEMFGFECAVVPFDMGVEAEALGSKVNFYTGHQDILYPTISHHLAERVVEIDLQIPEDLSGAGRIPVVTQALGILKKELGNEVAIGSWILGPYTLAGQLVDISDLAKSVFKRAELVDELLAKLSQVIIRLASIYRSAGADYITIREMGAGPDILSPRLFEKMILPHLKVIFSKIGSPNILHICGDTNAIVEQMYLSNADAISVEKRNDIALTRKKLGPEAIILGNIDGYNTLCKGTPSDVEVEVKEAIYRGVSSIWPGCDIWPEVPKANMEALVSTTEKYGKMG